MKFLRRLCSVLLLACMFFVVCSGSAFAQDINGYNVVSYYSVYDNGTGTAFEKTIETLSRPSQLYIVVDSIVSFDKGDLFDIEMGVSFGECGSVELIKTDLYNTSWSLVETIEGEFDGSYASVTGATAPRNLKCVRFTFLVNNPSYTLKSTEHITFPYGGQTFSFEYEEGMTWRQWVNSEYNLDGWFIEENRYVSRYYYNERIDENYIYSVYDMTLKRICSPDDIIDKSKTYTFSSTNISTYASGDVYQWEFVVNSFSAKLNDDSDVSVGIFGWVKKIAKSVTELPSKIVDGIGQKLTQLKDGLLDGIKNLFIPNEEQVLDLRNKFEELLASRFGAVYESSEIIDDFASAFQQEASISTADNGSSISFPTVTVMLADVPFTFGGWEVDIVPDRFEGVVDVLKVITSIVCTLAFVMAMRKRLEGVLK